MFCLRARTTNLAASVSLSLLFLGAASADDATITFFNSAFLPTTATINPGDTVTWEWAIGEHVLTSGASSAPEDDPGALFQAAIDEQNPTFSYTFVEVGSYPFFDALNENGLVGTIVVEPYEVIVGIVNNAFTPADVYIFEGDMIVWEWIEGDHTITSGAGSDPSENPGAIFDADNTIALPTFTWVFDEPGVVPYFCRPHEIFGMVGNVYVQRHFIRGDVNGDDVLDLADPINLLIYLFANGAAPDCLDAYDCDDDGVVALVDALDLLNALFAGGEGLPPPYPSAGPDRTTDEIYCN
ncbi:MAG: hypothetical protein L0Z55_07910 [Planctomycetes bacterium]|nr:hypothetical protein [Planctomycetota bacterium]